VEFYPDATCHCDSYGIILVHHMGSLLGPDPLILDILLVPSHGPVHCAYSNPKPCGSIFDGDPVVKG
jgi:hypothetical protein